MSQLHLSSTPRLYAFAGVAFASAIEFPGLPESISPACYRLVIAHDVDAPNGPPDRAYDWRDATGAINLSLRCYGGESYLLAPGLVWLGWKDQRLRLCEVRGACTSDVRHSVLNQILPRILDGAGSLMLHAALVCDSAQGGILLLGESRFGKSTLAAAFTQSGGRMLTDDGVRVDMEGAVPRALPTYPSLRLREDARAALFGDAAASAASDAFSARAVPGETRAVTLGAIVVLGPPGDATTVNVRRLATGDAALALVQNSFAFDPGDLQRARRRLAQVATVAERVPVYGLSYPRDYARLPEVIACLRTLPA